MKLLITATFKVTSQTFHKGDYADGLTPIQVKAYTEKGLLISVHKDLKR